MRRKINLLLLGCLLVPPAWALSLGTLTLGGAQKSVLSLSADEASQHPWVVIGPLSGALQVHLLLEGAGFRTLAELPLVAGLPVTWSWPLPPGTLRVSVSGVWKSAVATLRTTKRPAEGNELQVTRLRSGHPLYQFEFPAWNAAPSFTPQLILDVRAKGPWEATVSGEGVSKRFELGPEVTKWAYSPQAWGVPPRLVTLSAATDADFSPRELRATGIAGDQPLPADTATLLVWPHAQWRNSAREWFAWATAPNVLVLVTASYAVQDDYFKRLAFFVEKTGTRGTLVSDEALAGQHGWNAHDYAASDLANFYSLAAVRQFPLNPSELELRERLVASGILLVEGGGWKAGQGAVLGVSAESPPTLRGFLFTHEGFHGLYFTSDEFRRGVRDRWNQLSEGTKKAFRSFLAFSQYDPTDEPLMINEFQAYVLQQGRGAWPSYFGNRVLARSTNLSPAQRAQVVAELLVASADLEALAGRLFGVISGNLESVTALSGTKE
ncbi:MAG: hypothetical protein WCG80_12100 [Spirochaetales bacterium]